MIHPPPNPRAAEARAAMQAHNAAVDALREPVAPVAPAPDAPPKPALSDLWPRIVERWPDMERYADTARIDSILLWCGDVWEWRWRVTVTV